MKQQVEVSLKLSLWLDAASHGITPDVYINDGGHIRINGRKYLFHFLPLLFR